MYTYLKFTAKMCLGLYIKLPILCGSSTHRAMCRDISDTSWPSIHVYTYIHIYIYIFFLYTYLKFTALSPKNAEVALWLPTNCLMCSRYVSQKRNKAIDNSQWYNTLLNFIL